MWICRYAVAQCDRDMVALFCRYMVAHCYRDMVAQCDRDMVALFVEIWWLIVIEM